MAVRKEFDCDACGEGIASADVLVVRLGTLANRSEDSERYDVCPNCASDGPLLTLRDRMVMDRAKRGQDVNGDPMQEEAMP
jgi:hypothetical protein